MRVAIKDILKDDGQRRKLLVNVIKATQNRDGIMASLEQAEAAYDKVRGGIMKTLYTVSRCRKDDSLYGPLHGSDDGEVSVCGIILDHNWYITHDVFDGDVTCKKCLKILQEFPTIPERIRRSDGL